jgi:hypothetical protein
MKGKRHQQQGRGAFDLIEEATHLLRTAPVATLAVYYLGAIPFVLGLLYFWADMSRSPFANQHLTEAALGMAALFLWMKFWQVIFARRLRAQVAGEAPPRLNFRRCVRIFLAQAIVHPSALFVLPMSFIPLLPFPWVYAFYQNVTALDDGEPDKLSTLLKKSWKQATVWPRQNHIVLAILIVFGFYVFLNWTSVCFLLPHLVKMLFGVASAFTKSPFSMLNTTFFAAMFGLTYLCVDPILKTIYALRCFYGESLKSGEDLKAELKPFAVAPKPLAATLLILISLAAASPAKAAATNPIASAVAPVISKQIVSPPDLDHAINQTIHERKFTWRMPREKTVAPDSDEGIVARFFDNAGKMLRKWARATLNWLQDLFDKFSRHKPAVSAPATSGYGWIMSLQLLLYGLVAVLLVVLAIFLYRLWRGRRRSPKAVATEPIQPVPDLMDENVRADQLPEDGWTKLARELLERGEFRLAIRAFYLASLSHLAARNLINIARFKSNREYERELHRRAHSFPNLISVFGDNISVFERIWYGMHEVNRELVDHFAANVERIKAAG